MAGGITFISWPGVAFSVVGGMFYLVAWAKGTRARQINNAKQVNNIADLTLLGNVLPLLVAVTGRVWTEKPLKCELSDSNAAIVEVVEDQLSMKHLVGETWVKDVQRVRSSIRETPWVIEESAGLGSHTRLPIVDGRDAVLDDVLQLSGDCFQEAVRPLHKKAFDVIMGWRVMGTNRTERVLPVGMVVTAIGEVSKVKDIGGHIGLNGGLLRHQGDILVMRAPQHGPFIISKRSLGSIVTSLNEVSRICRYIAFGFTTVGVALVAIKAARGCMAHIRQKQLRARILAAASERGAVVVDADGHEHDQQGQEVDDLCAVCLTNRCSAVFALCGHMCACISCAERMDKCPICRAKTRVIRVYRT